MTCSVQKTPQRADAVTGRRLVLGNGDVRISYAWVGKTSPLYRNAVGDECVYVEDGTAVLETVFGACPSRGATTRSSRGRPPTAGSSRKEATARLYFIEANSHIGPPTPVPVQTRPIP